MTDQQIENKIKRIAGHSPHKLNTFELIYAAAEFEKFDIDDLRKQIDEVDLSKVQKGKLIERLSSFEPPKSNLHNPWLERPSTVR